MGIITAFAKSIDNSQLLRLLHQQIEKQDAPVACRDDLDDQLTDIAAYMHDEHYPALAKRRKKVNMLTGLLALPVLLFSLLLFSQKIIDALSLNIDIRYLSLTLLDYSLTYIWAVFIYAAVLFGTIFYFYFLQKQTEKYAGHLIDDFINRISH
ncbi:DUF6097 family protein [Morganella morganii]|mgnify:FL=1|uniref:DUF6097 family protein n=1 Tax=Morganella morganii TaxID=582 RepID=UPI0006691C36|nr:DUF6097 family protein [Morganella morganii]SSN06048.1 Uncharacterised protein [Klebsiella pneumoniae]EJD6110939.1 hypothetical protein [Morganella morganii]EJG2205646.1 hypothetical protein [Morganella morganii]EKU4014709.1 hypothetical protein [Morganella morganii]ELA7701925.1 hypothetical protein [Morganella morganii]